MIGPVKLIGAVAGGEVEERQASHAACLDGSSQCGIARRVASRRRCCERGDQRPIAIAVVAAEHHRLHPSFDRQLVGEEYRLHMVGEIDETVDECAGRCAEDVADTAFGEACGLLP